MSSGSLPVLRRHRPTQAEIDAANAAAPARPSAWVPPVIAVLTAIVGILNIVSNYSPSVRDRLHVLHQVEPIDFIPLAHALVLPIGISLVILSVYLAKR